MPRGKSPRNDGFRVCYKCKIEKTLDSFHRDAAFALGFGKVCKECYKSSNKLKNRRSKIKTDVDTYLTARITQLKWKAKKNNISFDITPSYLKHLYESQQGLCYYTYEPLKLDNGKGNKHDSLSVDRLTPTLGYVVGNVVLCTHSVNSLKNDRTEDEFKEFLLERIKMYTSYLERSRS